MLQGLYSAASGMNANLANQEILAHNLTHATVPGYRRRALTFESVEGSPDQENARLVGARVGQEYTGFDPGDYAYTGNPLECAIRGDGFFVLQGPDGPLYTRNGIFQLDTRGRLVTGSGLAVAGNITIPPNTARISIGEDGTVSADGQSVGQLRLASFADPEQLQRVGTTLFEAPPDVTAGRAAGKVIQGYREGANVQLVSELVAMMIRMRTYDAAAQALRSIEGSIQQRTQAQS
jgi:flagellar basal body rod protein FlgG